MGLVSAHMTPDEFRHYGRLAVDWIADYLENIEGYPVLSQVAPGEVRSRLPSAPPHHGEPFEALLDDLKPIILPGITHWQHPSFFAYFPANASGPAILADLLSAGLGVQGMLWATSPAATELEQHVLDWLADLLELPAKFRSDGPGGGVIQDTASTATLVALLAALHRATDGTVRRDGVSGAAGGRKGYAVYASTQAHSSVAKALLIAGLGEAALRPVEADPETLALDPDELRRLVEADIRDGVTPVMVAATVGSTSTGAIDPVPAIGEVCREHGIWLHIDAAYAGAAAVCPELRWIHDGVAEYADSYCTNPHKWLLTNFDCDAFYVADRTALLGALSILPEYLRNAASESGAVVDFRDWHIQLGRRFRALKLWAVIRWYGVEGLRAHIRGHVALAQTLADWVREDPRFEVVGPHPLSLVCFRLRGAGGGEVEEAGRAADDANATLMQRLNTSGDLYLTHTKIGDRMTLRLAIGGPLTEHRHVEAAWQAIREAADRIDAAA